jgi:hypothetical protein
MRGTARHSTARLKHSGSFKYVWHAELVASAAPLQTKANNSENRTYNSIQSRARTSTRTYNVLASILHAAAGLHNHDAVYPGLQWTPQC